MTYGSWPFQHITQAASGLDEGWSARAVEFASQVTDVDIDDVAVAVLVEIVAVGAQFVPGEDFADV
jgi:hypothetical protein